MSTIKFDTFKSKINDYKAFYGKMLSDKFNETDNFNFNNYVKCEELLKYIEIFKTLREVIELELKATDEVIKYENLNIRMPLEEGGKYLEFFITDGYIKRHESENGYISQYGYLKERFLNEFDEIILVNDDEEEIDIHDLI